MYETICDFVRSVSAELQAGVPVRDLVDAQSFLFLEGRADSQFLALRDAPSGCAERSA